ncbi:hypothetical protein BJ741DRAFT_629050 [Chytriomyces cf. hyalinus JEL632]|nr:hypothetical protein BJ741DRAFT_629050 [Chytriomyces cf. hyalinus JEL632]
MSSALERTNRRLKNTMGTLGAKVNLDGTLVQPRAVAVVVDGSITTGDSQQQQQLQQPSRLIFFGGQTVQPRNPKHGPGLAASIYSDMMQNLEKKKASQRQLAEFEKLQMKERSEIKSASRKQHASQDGQTKWIFDSRDVQREKNPVVIEEKEARFQLRKLSRNYADELSAQIAENSRFKDNLATALKKTDMDPKEAERHQFFNQQPVFRESRRMKPPRNMDHYKFDLINHSEKPKLASNPKRRPTTPLDLQHACPLNKPGQAAGNSLPLPTTPNSSTTSSTRQTTRRQKTDVVQRTEPGLTNRIHDPSKDDPNEPAYFHFGRPGNGAPLLDRATRSKIDARLLAYKGDSHFEKLRVTDLLRV